MHRSLDVLPRVVPAGPSPGQHLAWPARTLQTFLEPAALADGLENGGYYDSLTLHEPAAAALDNHAAAALWAFSERLVEKATS